MKIDEVKVRLSNLDAGKVVKYDHAMNLATQYMVDYRNDVTYLLSIIELVEQDLTYMKQYGELNNVVDKIKFCIDSSLKAIRGN